MTVFPSSGNFLANQEDACSISNPCFHTAIPTVLGSKTIQFVSKNIKKTLLKKQKSSFEGKEKTAKNFLRKSFVKRSNICSSLGKVGCVIVSPCGGDLDLLGGGGEHYSTITVCNSNFNGELT